MRNKEETRPSSSTPTTETGTQLLSTLVLQGYLAHKKHPPSLRPPYGPRDRPTVGSYGGDVSYERGTPVTDNYCRTPGSTFALNCKLLQDDEQKKSKLVLFPDGSCSPPRHTGEQVGQPFFCTTRAIKLHVHFHLYQGMKRVIRIKSV